MAVDDMPIVKLHQQIMECPPEGSAFSSNLRQQCGLIGDKVAPFYGILCVSVLVICTVIIV